MTTPPSRTLLDGQPPSQSTRPLLATLPGSITSPVRTRREVRGGRYPSPAHRARSAWTACWLSARNPGIDRPLTFLVRARRPIEFKAPDQDPASLMLAMLVPEQGDRDGRRSIAPGHLEAARLTGRRALPAPAVSDDQGTNR